MDEQQTPEKQALNEILSDMVADATPVAPDDAPSGTVPLTGRNRKRERQVEVIPGIMVSQKLIDEAVKYTSTGATEWQAEAREAALERERERIAMNNAELRRDIDNSRQFVIGMLQRMREPMKYDEKFVSYDTMPGPLQRVVKAYVEAEEANRNLADAVAALAKDLEPPVVKAA
jgi:hypothetical protein